MEYRLKAASGAQTGQTFALGETTGIGAAPKADIRIEGLAEQHARIVCRDGGLVLEADGDVRVNGEPVSRVSLQSGDELQFGHHRFVLQAPGLKPARVLDRIPERRGGAWKWWIAAGAAAAAAAAGGWLLFGPAAGA
jgi:hypothetical protein